MQRVPRVLHRQFYVFVVQDVAAEAARQYVNVGQMTPELTAHLAALAAIEAAEQ